MANNMDQDVIDAKSPLDKAKILLASVEEQARRQGGPAGKELFDYCRPSLDSLSLLSIAESLSTMVAIIEEERVKANG